MRVAHARMEMPDGALVDLPVGGIIGRVRTASLVLNDPQVSEAHAMLSVRRGRLVLLALRRLLRLGDKTVRAIELRPNMRVGFSDDCSIRVVSLALPQTVMALRAAGLGERELGPVASVFGGPTPTMRDRFDPEADAYLWSVGDGWWLRQPGQTARAVRPGDSFEAGGTKFELDEMRAAHDIPSTTASARVAPLRIVCHYDSVEIHRDGEPAMHFGGVGARIVCELVAFEGPVEWQLVAGEIWDDAPKIDERDLRARWDASVSRLRRRLIAAGIERPLVQSDGRGHVTLIREAGDTIEDRS